MAKTKKCEACGKRLALSEKHFAKNYRTADGFERSCLSCKNSARYARHYHGNLKVCRACGQRLQPDTDNFYKKSSSFDGLEHSCKKCRVESDRRRLKDPKTRKRKTDIARDWRKDNKEQSRQYARQWRERNPEYQQEHYRANKERIDKKNRVWAEKNPEKRRAISRRHYESDKKNMLRRSREWYRQNTERHRERTEAWRQNNREAFNSIARNRRARMRKAKGSHTIDDIRSLLEAQSYLCYYCGEDLDKVNYEVDHYVPLAKNGSNDPSNLVIACMPCNRAKKDKMPDEFIASLERR